MKTKFFGDMFDFNDDGEVDEIESAAEILYLETLSDATDNEDDVNDSDVTDDFWDEDTSDEDSWEDSNE